MKILETKKLHYNKYLYKFEIRNELASIFRTEFQKNGKLQYARSRLDECKLAREVQGYVYIPHKFSDNPKKIPLAHLLDAEKIYSILLKEHKYLVRCGIWNNNLSIYSNDLKLMNNLVDKTLEIEKYFWKPLDENVDFLLRNANIIIVNKEPKFPYKVTFGNKNINGKELHSWITKNQNKVKAGDTFLHLLLEQNPYIRGLYLYVKNEHTLTLLNILAGNNITRIDKLIYKTDLDK
jgi:hypothetical protein